MKTLVRINMYLDGGTSVWVEQNLKKEIKSIEEARNIQKYYLDGRVHSSTKGELFDKYPGDIDAKQVNKSDFIFYIEKLTFPGYMSKEAQMFFEGHTIEEERDGCATVETFVKLANGKIVLPSKGAKFSKNEEGKIIQL